MKKTKFKIGMNPNSRNGFKKGHGLNTTHNMSLERFYRIWKAMKSRCNNPKNNGYKFYGGRGIKVEWHSFEEFKRDMLKTYKDNLSIDRIDNDGNYSKENCRWTTSLEQANNHSNNLIIDFN